MNNPIKYILYFFLSFIIIGGVFFSCISEDDYIKDSSFKLSFSSDTLHFDTVFTTMGSVTQNIRVYNNGDKPVKIDRISIFGGYNSFFRLNVDGDTSMVVKDVEIGAKDSLYIFARVTIDPLNQNNPLLVKDSIFFSFNGKTQYVFLEAFGQDAYYHVSKRELGDGIKYCLAQDGGEKSGVSLNGNYIEWLNDKPHVIFGILAIDSAYTLNIPEGTNIHLNTSSEFWVYTDATLLVNGSQQSPVVFQGMRKDGYYSSLPGQWDKIWFWAGSRNSSLNNVVIKNGTIGIMADSCVTNNAPTISMYNVIIENMSNYGLYSRGATIEAANLVIQNTAMETLALTMGGKYQFVGCSFANYWSYSSRGAHKTLFLQNYYEDIYGNINIRPIEQCNFYNSIVYGQMEEEIQIDKIENGDINLLFESCLLKTLILNNQSYQTSNCIFNEDPQFNNPQEGDLQLKSSSKLFGKGNSSWNNVYPTDIKGNLRAYPPTIGAYEQAFSQ